MKALQAPGQSAGAFGVLGPLSGLAEDDLAVTIDMKASETIGTPVIVTRPASRSRQLFAPLTSRQKQVAELILAGQSNKQIARTLGISLGTVKDHVHAILQRLGQPSRAALIAAHARKT